MEESIENLAISSLKFDPNSILYTHGHSMEET